ncbi:zinc finger, CCHC-type containing protein [Tanacetum coccineum]
MDVKTTFLNGDLEEEVNMKQSEGFVMPGNEHKRKCRTHSEQDSAVAWLGFHRSAHVTRRGPRMLLTRSLQAYGYYKPRMGLIDARALLCKGKVLPSLATGRALGVWSVPSVLVGRRMMMGVKTVSSNPPLLASTLLKPDVSRLVNPTKILDSNLIAYFLFSRKFDGSGKGVIICVYVDDMLIFDTDQNQVDKTKKFLSSKFSMKHMVEPDVILGIKIKRENKGIVITQSHYIEKILKKFNRKDCSPVSTPMDLVEKLIPNIGKLVDQLEYSRAIGCLMYAMTSTRPGIAYAVGRLCWFTSNPSRQH